MGGYYINDAVNLLCKKFPDYSVTKKLAFFVAKNVWTVEDRQIILNLIAESLTIPDLTDTVSEYFSPILLDLFHRINHNQTSLTLFCILSKLFGYYASASNFAYESFSSNIFASKDFLVQIKKNPTLQIEFIEACYSFICFDSKFLKYSFDWSFISSFNLHSNNYVRYLSLQIYQILLNLDLDSTETLIQNFPDGRDLSEYKLKCFDLSKTRKLKYINCAIKYQKTLNENYGIIFDCDFSSQVVSVFGILLTKSNHFIEQDENYIVLPSIEDNLRSIALGVSIGKPILVEGSMGCGKSMLIKHFASLTGRSKPPDILSIQISDQIDTKYLLGSYICSDIPGEFVFNLGPLLKAIRDGSWIVLEDVDSASPDIISLISSIVESKTTSCIPGCENKIDKYDSNFRIFFTRRYSANQSFEISNLNSINMLEKMCFKISFKNLDILELEQLIITKWKILAPIVSRILEIYTNITNSDVKSRFKRFITLRDLAKWCTRLSKYFQLNSSQVSKYAFLDAIDCFMSFNSNLQIIENSSLIISSSLNVTKSECEFLLANRCPQFSVSDDLITIGRQVIERNSVLGDLKNFAFTTQSLLLLEKLFICVNNHESVLLCGETGVGKTSCIQYLANLYGKKLIVINMNQQSDSIELFGGYKPINIKFLLSSIKNDYQHLFSVTFDAEKNSTFLTKFIQIYNKEDWSTLLSIMLHVCSKAFNKVSDDQQLLQKWQSINTKLNQINDHLQSKSGITFSFIEGALTQAIQQGQWVLLDEINLAEYETLQSLLSLLENDGSFFLSERGNDQFVQVHKDFRLFACMNPATDVGKKELPIGIQNRFTEFYIHEITDKTNFRVLVSAYIGNLVGTQTIEAIVNFYIQIKSDAANILKDINGFRPIYSLRNLCRALHTASLNPFTFIHRSIYESFCLSFLSNLDANSYEYVEKLIENVIFRNINLNNLLKTKIESPCNKRFVMVENYPIVKGPNEIYCDQNYILTPIVKKNLKDVCRIISAGVLYPILLQGETAVGKTSLINWLAKATGNVCFRVNNHEHTDLQEYVGNYSSDTNGKIVFKEGILVDAMKKGYWIILDELNLAPTEVLEALNRVLDDNRELFIPETQETIKAHSRFLLFATQNPPGRYGGRKILSRAFRNRFIELNFNEIPSQELEIILHRKCLLPLSYAKRMVSVLLELQLCRSKSDIFAGKHGLITLRDLFRWGYRYIKFASDLDPEITFFDWNQYLANQGYMLLAGRARKSEEIAIIKSIIENKFKCNISLDDVFYSNNFEDSLQFKNIVWTKAFRRLATLIQEAIKYKEPILLVGETGCGKTTIIQYFSSIMKIDLKIINCHMNTESADFLGSLRPNRNIADNTNNSLFEWVDGPLIKAMKDGSYFLADEISLADDSVLERLNSVLELDRTIFLAENSETSAIYAKSSFRYFATMNPAGDYGKKELSPALRDRFTEIWCPIYEDIEDIKLIIRHNLQINSAEVNNILCDIICDFISWFNHSILMSKQFTYSIRDIISWVNFINQTYVLQNCLSLREAFANGASLVFIDSLGSSNKMIKSDNILAIRESCGDYINGLSSKLPLKNVNKISTIANNHFTVGPFNIEKGSFSINHCSNYYWQSCGIQANLSRIMRAFQLEKSILLEGPPGVGKTSLIQALASATGHSLIRINLSDQTDITDLFGCDLPMEGENSAGKFEFRDGPLLKALKSESTWILLDELNLASQTVLEGLNACLDHRGEIYIPELNRTFYLDKAKTRIFASQNPFSMDGTRKGLPKSFLNRFTIVYIDNLTDKDFYFILSNLYPNIDSILINKMISINHKIQRKILEDVSFAKKGSPFEFNLRDLLRWAEVTSNSAALVGKISPEMFFDLIYASKMRTNDDKEKLKILCWEEFNYRKDSRDIACYFFNSKIQFGYSFLTKTLCDTDFQDVSFIFESHKEIIESIMKCIEMNWLTILIGNSGQSKSFLIKLLANMCGHRLNVLSVNSEMDTTDLLGGFEQKDFANDLKDVEENILDLCFCLLKQEYSNFKLVAHFFALLFRLNLLSNSNQANLNEFLNSKITISLQILELFDQKNVEIAILTEKLDNLKRVIKEKQLVNGSFEWKDSKLIRSIQNGDWVLIDNANFLNSSVLDRLNSLLETNGSLILNEKGSVNGQLTCIKPHKQFRLFITMNPQFGELSRPMRNRGIEIVVPDWIDTNEIKLLTTKYNIEYNTTTRKEWNFGDYNSYFKFIYETILKSQHGYDLNDIVSIPAVESSQPLSVEISKPLIVNNLINDCTVYYALQDYLVLTDQNSSINPTVLRLFLENSSIQDYSLRCSILHRNKFVLTNDLQDYTFIFERLKDDLSTILSKLEYNATKCLPVHFRENIYLSNFINTCVQFNPDNIKLLKQKLNKYHLNLFWLDLNQRLTSSSNTHEDSLMAIATKIYDGQLNSKLYPNCVLPIFEAIQLIKNEVINLFLDTCLCSDDLVQIRYYIVLLYQLLTCCYEKFVSNWNQFISEDFFPLWFIVNEKIFNSPKAPINYDKLNNFVKKVNFIFNLEHYLFNKPKFTLIKKFTSNHFNFNSQEAVNFYDQFVQITKLMTKAKLINTRVYNGISFKSTNLLISYFNGNITFPDASTKMVSFCDLIKTNLSRQNSLLTISDNEQRLVKSDLLLTSILSNKLMSYFSNEISDIKDIVTLAEENKFAINPMILFYGLTMKTCYNFGQFTDLFNSFIANVNDELNINSIIEYFQISNNIESAKAKSNCLVLSNSNDKISSLTFEFMPLLSLTCFNIYQLEQISIEEFNVKSFTLNFLMKLLTDNYVLFKTRKNLFFDKIFNYAKASYDRLALLDPNVLNQFKTMSAMLPSCDLAKATNDEDKCFYLIVTGYLIFSMTVVDFSIDPIVRSQVKLENCKLEAKIIQEEISLRLKLNQQKFCYTDDAFHNELDKSLKSKLDCNNVKIAESINLPSRLNPSKYFDLKSDINQFCTTIFNWKILHQLCLELNKCLVDSESIDTSKANQLMANCLNYQHSLAEFVQHISHSYRNYHDLTSAGISGVNLVLKGLQLITYRLRSICNTQLWFSSFEPNSVDKLFKMFFRFVHIYSPHEIGEFIFNQDCVDKFVNIASNLNIDEKSLVTSLIKSAFIEIENSILLGFDKKYLYALYLKIVDLFVQWWRKVKDEEEMAKLKEEALFHLKLEDESDEEQIKTVFPLFEDKFQDLMDNDQLDNYNQDKSLPNSSIQLNVSKETLLFVIRSHMKLTILENDDSQTSPVPDFVKPYLIRYQFISNIYKKTLGFIDLDMENELIDGHILVNKHLLDSTQQTDSEERPINVYRESSLSQTRQCYLIIEKLKNKIIIELLPQFENHPSLLKLLQIIERICQLDINSSLMSFATGLELLLKTAENWQLIAHRGISLIDHLNEITELLVSWRKLEIKYWAQCLEIILTKIEEKELTTWWFYFYTTLSDVIQSENQELVDDLVNSVKKYIERSTLGQFHIRLRILKCFIHQLQHTGNDAVSKRILSAFKNLFNFYNYFEGKVSQAIESERKPIEKEIKELVQISKWNPNNFWSLKASLNKSHRQLFSYLKKFESLLCKPANVAFEFDKSLKLTHWKMTTSKIFWVTNFDSNFLFDSSQDFYHDYKLLFKSKTLILKSDKYTRKIINSSKTLINEINQLEESNISLIEGVNEYQNLKVVETKDLDKWKKSVGQIQTKKRRALSELFKKLYHYGLSFRKGNIHFNDLSMDRVMCTINSLTSYRSADEQTMQNIVSSNSYFYKCISDYMKFVTAIEKPNSQLTFDMVERIRGFSVELTRAVMRRHKMTSDCLLSLHKLDSYLLEMKERSNVDNCSIIDFKDLQDNFGKIKSLVTQLMSFTIRLKTVLAAISQEVSSNNVPLIENISTKCSIQDINQLDKIIFDIKKIYEDYDLSSCLFYTSTDLGKLKLITTQLSVHLDSINEVLSKDTRLLKINNDNLNYFVDEIADISSYVEELDRFYCRTCYISALRPTKSKTSDQCENIVRNILICIEKLYASICSSHQLPSDNETELDDDLNLIKRVDFSNILFQFNIPKIIKLVEDFFNLINSDKKEFGKLNYMLICTLCPFLDVYINLFKHVLLLSSGSLKTTNKMLHILLSLFNELLTNGFCIPPEPNNEPVPDSQLKDLKNSGFGDGDTTGAEDVSGRLDCQDQLDDMLKTNESQTGEDDNEEQSLNDDKGIEMDDDFEGNDYSPKQDDNVSENDNDESEEDENLDDKMGNVDDESEILDEKMWGDDGDDDNDNSDELDENNEFGGKDNTETEVVANEENKDLKQNQDDNPQTDKDEEENEDDKLNEMTDSAMDDDYLNENPDIYKENANQNSIENQEEKKIDLPENMELDDISDGDGDDSGDESQKDDDNDVTDVDQIEEDSNDDAEMDQIDDKLGNELNKDDNSNDDIDNNENNLDITSEEQQNESQMNNEELVNDVNAGHSTNQTNTCPIDNEDDNKENNSNETEFKDSSSNTAKDRISETVSDQNPDSSSKEQNRFEQSLSKNNKKKNRSLAEEAKSAKRQKIINSVNDNSEEKSTEQLQSDTYRHVDNADKANELAYDIAEQEDFEQQQLETIERGIDISEETIVKHDEDIELNEDIDDKLRHDNKSKDNSANSENISKQDEVYTEGEIVLTTNVKRDNESFFSTNLEQPMIIDTTEDTAFCLPKDDTLPFEYSTIDSWKECERKIEPLIYELCNQLQLVLEPTKCSKFKGDFKSGKRLNMRKVIAYVASDFRKDKIWLRRSKPSKRQYQIIIAVDDSLSMSDNRSKQIAFESLILLGKSLSIIESGALSVLSFGEVVRILHSFNEPFTDQSALKMFSKFLFNQQKTKIIELLQCCSTMFSNSKQTIGKGSNCSTYQLLLIVSDGRGIYSEGNDNVQRAILKLKENNIFSVFIIIDNPEHKNSILDIRVPVFNESGKIKIESYIEKFPFPFYVILKEINSLPSILGEALRQWFELVTNEK